MTLPRPPPSTDRTVEAAQTLQHQNWTFRDVGWVDVAYNLTPELDADDIHVEVEAHGPPREKPGKEAIWTCWIAAPGTPEATRIISERDFTASWCWMFNTPNEPDRWEYGARYGRHGQSIDQPSPWCRAFDCSSESYDYKVTTDAVEKYGFYEEFREDWNESVVHWTVMTGGIAAGRVEVEATYRNTTVNVTDGPPSDLFSYQRDDFRAERAVWMEHSRAYRYNATLKTDLAPGSGPTFYTYDPLSPGERNTLDEGPAWVVEPDGDRRSPAGAHLFDLSGEDGRWTFGFRQSGGRHVDMPVLRGAGFEWAELDG